MASYRLLLKPSVGEDLAELGTKADRRRIVARIQALAEDPRPPGSEKLGGHEFRHRVRQGNYRIVYEIDDEKAEVTIYRVGHRKDVYRLR